MEAVRRVPCSHCREKHLKCDNDDTCANCTKSGKECIRARKRARFAKAKRFAASLEFAEDQTWVQTKNADQLSFIDGTPRATRPTRTRTRSTGHRANAADPSSDVDESSIAASDAEATSESPPNGDDHFEETPAEVVPSTSMPPPSYESLARPTPSNAHSSSDARPQYRPERSFSIHSNPAFSPGAYSDGALGVPPIGSGSWQGSQHIAGSPGAQSFPNMSNVTHSGVIASPLDTALRNRVPSNALRGLPEGFTDEAYLRKQEACLMRHYVEVLAPWFEITDRDRHYSTVVPQRAMFCPVLLYAVYTASAHHLTMLSRKRGPGQVIHFRDIPLPELNEATAIHYHNKCINCLIEISTNPALSYNEDALTAATILRFYEQIDTPFTGQDAEIYLNVVRAVVETQQDESFYAIQKIHGPVRDLDPFIPVAVSLRHSACLTALRQEIWSVLLYRRPIQLPISPINDFELLVDPPPADDYVWANRILVWTADVLKFCFGGLELRRADGVSNNPSPSLNVDSKSRVEHWQGLKRFEVTWQMQQPASFKPVFYDHSSSEEVFPQIWHNSDVQVLALQHVELASLLLSVYDPRLPRLGLTALSAHRSTAAQIRTATLRICGLAVCRKDCATTMTIAAAAISVCGSYFENSDHREQNALIRFLEDFETRHAWPTGSVIASLREAWAENTPASFVT